MARWLTVVLTLALCSMEGPVRSGEKEAVFDLKAILTPPLNTRTTTTTEKDGIVTEEVMFHSEKDGAKSVDIFAFFSYPKGARKLPAFIWNQGGLGQASTYWTEFGAKRGYATLCIDFPLPGYRSTGGYPINSGLELGEDPKRAPIYHGAVALLRAVSYLESRPEVDADRIGMAGSSWGGFYTTLMAGVDPRLKAASSMFGTGNLQVGNSWWDGTGNSSRDAAQREHWRTTLDPAWRLPRSKTPIAWFTTTNDNFYWLPAVNRSYEMAVAPKHLTMVPNWDHALAPTMDEQVFTWLDIHLRGKPAFLHVSPLKIAKEGDHLVARWTFDGPRRAQAAELMVSYGDGDWRGRWWVTVPAEMKDGKCSARVPVGAWSCHVGGAVVDADGFRSSTPLVRTLGVNSSEAVPDYNGCGQWGSFEAGHITYLKLHGYPTPAVRPDPKEGKQAAVFKAGKSPLPPIYGTAGVPHRFTCWLKADRPTEVTLSLEARTPGKPVLMQKTVKISADWTEAAVDFLPPRDMVGSVRAIVVVPAGVEALMDAVGFRPAPTPAKN